MSGMLSSGELSPCLRGRRRVPSVGVVVAQEGTMGMVRWRRHLPSWRTSGMFAPTGALVMVKVPSAAVVALTSGPPEAGAWQDLHTGPDGMGSSGAFGTYT